MPWILALPFDVCPKVSGCACSGSFKLLASTYGLAFKVFIVLWNRSCVVTIELRCNDSQVHAQQQVVNLLETEWDDILQAKREGGQLVVKHSLLVEAAAAFFTTASGKLCWLYQDVLSVWPTATIPTSEHFAEHSVKRSRILHANVTACTDQ